MKYSYVLKITSNSNINNELINNILNKKPSKITDKTWELELIENENDDHIEFIGYFLDILEDKYFALNNIGIKNDDISIWMLYEYENQCNIEFSAKDMKRLGDKNIDLCISCWQKE